MESIDYGPDYRWYNREEKRHHGEPLTWLNGFKVYSYVPGRLGSLNSRVLRASRPRRLEVALEELRERCREESIPRHVCETAAHILVSLHARKPGMFNKRLVPAIIEASLHLAGGLGGHPYPLRDKRLRGVALRIAYVLGVRLTGPSTLRALVARLSSGMPPVVALDAARILSLYRPQRALAPASLAAAAVYTAAHINDVRAPQSSLAREAGITDTSLRTALKAMDIRIVYRIDGRPVDEWRPGIHSLGIPTPGYIAYRHGVEHYTYTTTIAKPITVDIHAYMH